MFKLFEMLMSSIHTWPTWARRTYLLTFPISMLAQFAAVIIAFIACAVIIGVMDSGVWVRSVWRGEKPKFTEITDRGRSNV